MQVKVDRRFANGFLVQSSYTYAKALGYQSEDAGLAFYINPRRNWEQLDFDRRHNLALGYVYELPFGKGKRFGNENRAVAAIAGGWQMNGSFWVLSGTRLNFRGNSAVLRAPGNSNTLNHFGSIATPKGNGTLAPWFDPTVCTASITTNCFGQPANLTFGNLGPNAIAGPGSWDMSLSVFRSFKIGERLSLQIRGESFSTINTPQWNNPDTNINNKTFGYITFAVLIVIIQLVTKVVRNTRGTAHVRVL